MMKAELKRICELQPFYSPDNTPEMKERGELLRNVLVPALREFTSELSGSLGSFGSDLSIDASDGIGRKTELPWVRFCSSRMSPSPTEGFYCVVHFSTDGSAIHVTLGCGSSRFHNGSFSVLPHSELDQQTVWARSVIAEALGTLEPFIDPADFGATRKLPMSFQRATAMSKRIGYDDIDTYDINALLKLAAERLRLIYDAQALGRDVSPADQSESEIDAVMNSASGRSRRQGYGLPTEARRAVELRAMTLAKRWLESEGYVVEDHSASSPFDYQAAKDGELLKVEVKGTTSDSADSILMTRNEVELHRTELGATGLIIVSKIRLLKVDGKYVAKGGDLEPLIGWDITGWHAEPTAFRLSRGRAR